MTIHKRKNEGNRREFSPKYITRCYYGKIRDSATKLKDIAKLKANNPLRHNRYFSFSAAYRHF